MLSHFFSVFPAGRYLLLLLLIGFSCQKTLKQEGALRQSGPLMASEAVLREYNLSPATTDPEINTFLAAHFASVNEGASLKNTLFVFIPGTYRAPAESKGIERKAASLGYHVIGLSYPNSVAGNPLCKGTNDITCHRRARQETIDGIDRHPSVNVNPTNSIINRLTKLLIYLHNTHPSENWGQYLSSGSVDWGKVIICGHSQGASLAGVMGKMYPVKKVIMLSMIDFLDNGEIPDWQTFPENKEKYYALTNTKDELVPYDKVVTGWGVMGMSDYGPVLNTGTTAAPYQSTHTLITTVDPVTTLADRYHNGTAIDTYIPKDATGKYIYDEAWAYLIDGIPSAPPITNQLPIANAGTDQTIPASWNYSPTANGTLSRDPDGWIAAFSWSKVSGPSAYTIATPTTGQTKLNDLVPGTYIFRVTVTDNKGATASDDVQITITGTTAPSNQPPVANAGTDQDIPLSWNYSPTANGTLSKDPDGWIAAFSWTKVSGPSSYTIATPTKGQTKLNDLVGGTYVFRVTVTDDKGATSSDDVTVRMY